MVLAREAPVTNDGPHHRLPFDGPGAVGLGKPLKPIVHPLRADLPIWLGAEGPKNVAQTAEIADGWIPIFYTPKSAGMNQPWLDERSEAHTSELQSLTRISYAVFCLKTTKTIYQR